MTDSTAGYAYSLGLYNAANTLFSSTAQVVFGNPGMYNADDIIEFGGVSSTQDFATMSTNRTREETLEQEVVISLFRGGNQNVEQTVRAACFAYANTLAEYVRVTDTTLGGAVRQCFLTATQYNSGESDQSMAEGRIGVLVATFTARARITS